MQVICTDGTLFTCEGYVLTEYGVKLLAEDRDADEERYDSDPDVVGYVPHDRLWYIVPDGVRPNGPAASPPQGTQRGQQPTDPATGGNRSRRRAARGSTPPR